MLALDHDNRVDIVKRGGLLPLIQMACSSDEKVQHAGVEVQKGEGRGQECREMIVQFSRLMSSSMACMAWERIGHAWHIVAQCMLVSANPSLITWVE